MCRQMRPVKLPNSPPVVNSAEVQSSKHTDSHFQTEDAKPERAVAEAAADNAVAPEAQSTADPLAESASNSTDTSLRYHSYSTTAVAAAAEAAAVAETRLEEAVPKAAVAEEASHDPGPTDSAAVVALEAELAEDSTAAVVVAAAEEEEVAADSIAVAAAAAAGSTVELADSDSPAAASAAAAETGAVVADAAVEGAAECRHSKSRRSTIQ